MQIKKSQRNFLINSFRNIGFYEEKPKDEKLILNYSMEKQYTGDLVILIGPNNSGKSNILDALVCFYNENITEDDKNDTLTQPQLQKPQLTLKIENGSDNYQITLDDSNSYSYFLANHRIDEDIYDPNSYINTNINHVVFYNECKQINSLLMKVNINISKSLFEKNETLVSREQLIEFLNKSGRCIIDLFKKEKVDPNLYNQLIRYAYFKKLFDKFMELAKSLIPNIFRYQETNITNKDLTCEPSNIRNSDFFCFIV